MAEGKQEKKEQAEKEKKEQKTIGDYGYVRVNIMSDEFADVGVKESMYAWEASKIIRDALGLKERDRARDPVNAMLREAKEKAKSEGKMEELQRLVNKFLQK